jgi:hypothetical protein
LVENFFRNLTSSEVSQKKHSPLVESLTGMISEEEAEKWAEEDGLHYFTSKENNIKILITRNGKYYKEKDIMIQTAEEYIKSK